MFASPDKGDPWEAHDRRFRFGETGHVDVK